VAKGQSQLTRWSKEQSDTAREHQDLVRLTSQDDMSVGPCVALSKGSVVGVDVSGFTEAVDEPLL
jgi:hypothetical protein